MAACPKYTIDSNVVGLSYALEGCIGKLPDVVPDSGAEDGAVWYPLDPNEFDDFGGEVTTTARNPINASRQRKKGVVTDLEASAGFNQDVTQNNLPRLMQGFFFADARERVSTHPINGKSASTITLVDVIAATTDIEVGTGFGAKFAVGHILRLSNMANAANNRTDIIVESIVGDVLSVSGVLVNETPTPACKLEIIGYQFPDADAGIVFAAGEVLTLTRTAGSFVTDGFNVGEWIFIGGDSAATRFDNNAPGYARIEAVTAGALTLREPTWVPVTEAAEAGETIQIYFGTFIRNESTTALIKRRSYQLERTLGQDATGVQSEYIVGAVPNEFSLNVTSADKMTADLSFMALDNQLRNGTEGLKAGTRVTMVEEDAYNTSNDVYQLRLFVTDPLKASPSSLYAKVMEASITIGNNASGLKAIGTLGSFDINVGDFEVGGDLEAYFSTIAAVKAVKNNADVGFNMICSKDNSGFIYDIPLLSLGGGRVEVSKDEPIKLPLETSGAENNFGYTMSATYFSYLPTVAMATQD